MDYNDNNVMISVTNWFYIERFRQCVRDREYMSIANAGLWINLNWIIMDTVESLTKIVMYMFAEQVLNPVDGIVVIYLDRMAKFFELCIIQIWRHWMRFLEMLIKWSNYGRPILCLRILEWWLYVVWNLFEYDLVKSRFS